MRGRGLELPQGSFVLRALSTESRREIQGGLRSILASFSGASRSFCASAAGVLPFPGRTAPGAGRQRLPVAVFPTLWYFAALFFRGDDDLPRRSRAFTQRGEIPVSNKPFFLILAPMDGVLDAPMREELTECAHYDCCVPEFIRVNDLPVPGSVLLKKMPELRAGSRTAPGTPVRAQLLGEAAECRALRQGCLRALSCPGLPQALPRRLCRRSGRGDVFLPQPGNLQFCSGELFPRALQFLPDANQVCCSAGPEASDRICQDSAAARRKTRHPAPQFGYFRLTGSACQSSASLFMTSSSIC